MPTLCARRFSFALRMSYGSADLDGLDRSWPGLSSVGRGAGGDFAEVELDQPGVVVAIAALRHLEDLRAEVAGELAPGATGLSAHHILELREVGVSLAGWGALGVSGRASRLARSRIFL